MCVNTTIKFVSSVAASVEILQKEVVVHKEMVAELRTQLAEKEQEFQVSYMYMHVTFSVHNFYVYQHQFRHTYNYSLI